MQVRTSFFTSSARPTTLALCLAGSILAAAPAWATPLNYDIPAGSLAATLSEFAAASGVMITFSSEDTAGLRSPGLQGSYELEQGFAQLLQGSGLRVVQAGENRFVLAKVENGEALQLQATSVTGSQLLSANGQSDTGYRAINSTTASKTSTSLTDTPRSVSVVTRRRMDDQKSQTLTEVLGYVPGIFAPPFAAGDGQAGDLFFIRGFNATDYGYGLLRDGLRVQGNRYDTTSEPYGLERIEVFRGPTSILYGENAPGGVVNLVSKRPTENARGQIQLSYGSHDRRQLGVDVSGPMNDSGNVLGRMVVLGRKSGTQVDHQPDDRLYLAPSLTLNFNDANTLTLLGTYQKDRTLMELGYPAAGTLLDNPNGKIDQSTLLGNPDWDNFERETWTVGYEYAHSFNESWQFRQNSRYMQSSIERQEMWPGNLNNGGFGTTVTNTAYDRENRSIAYSLDNQIEGNFDFGNIANTLLFGVSIDRTSFDQNWNAGFGGIVDVFDPIYTAPPVTSTPVQNALLEQTLYGGYTQLQSRFENWIFLLGGRYDRVNSAYRNKAGTLNAPADLDYWNGQFTWQAGVMYQFENGLSPYLSYSTAYNPTQQVSSASGPLEPTTSEQYEVGVKYELTGWNTAISASVYDLRKKDDSLYDSAVGDYRNVGRSRAKGMELEVSSDLTDNLNLTSAYTYTDSRITNDGPGSLLEGHQVTGVPRNQASIWANYRFLDGGLRGLRIGGGVRHFDSTFAYTSPSLYGKLDTGDVTLVDAAVGYSIDEQWSAELNARNLLDKEYVAGCNNAGRCYWGEERTLLATLTFNW